MLFPSPPGSAGVLFLANGILTRHVRGFQPQLNNMEEGAVLQEIQELRKTTQLMEQGASAARVHTEL
jgi:hypothetical protein